MENKVSRILNYGGREKTAQTVPEAVRRFREKLKEMFRKGRGRSVKRVIAELTPVIREWGQYFRLSEVKGIFVELDSWIRRKLR